MAKPRNTPKLDDLKKKAPTAQEIERIKGGVKRRGGDDDLDDLEVER